MSKFVTAPLSINDMDTDLESKIVYIFDYEKSSYKKEEFYNYVSNIGVIADIYFTKETPFDDIELILEKYMNDKRFLHFSSLNIIIFNCLLYLKGCKRIPSSSLSCLTEEQEKEFLNNHLDLFNDWKKFYDSLFLYILCLATLPENCSEKTKLIKERFEGIEVNNTRDISPIIVSLLLDDYFYSYYDSGIDESLINYYPYYFENYLYDEKNIIPYLMGENNYYLKIINDSLYNEEFQKFIKNQNYL